MWKRLVSLIAAVLVLGLVAAAADAQVKPYVRKAQGTYANPAVGLAGWGGGSCRQTDGFGCVEFRTKRIEDHITISIKDSSGQPVYASIAQDKSTNKGPAPTQTEPVGDICGKTTKPLPIEGGYPVDVFIWEGPGPDPPCAGVATQGSVTARFTV